MGATPDGRSLRPRDAQSPSIEGKQEAPVRVADPSLVDRDPPGFYLLWSSSPPPPQLLALATIAAPRFPPPAEAGGVRGAGEPGGRGDAGGVTPLSHRGASSGGPISP